MISADPKQADRVAPNSNACRVRALYAVSGAYDMIAVVETETTARMDTTLDRIGRAPRRGAHGVVDSAVGEICAVNGAMLKSGQDFTGTAGILPARSRKLRDADGTSAVPVKSRPLVGMEFDGAHKRRITFHKTQSGRVSAQCFRIS